MSNLTREKRREILLKYTPRKIAESLKNPLEIRWGYGGDQSVLDTVQFQFGLLLPEHENFARASFAQLTWPKGMGSPPTWETLFGSSEVCQRCSGTGVTGYLFGIRCPDCGGSRRWGKV